MSAILGALAGSGLGNAIGSVQEALSNIVSRIISTLGRAFDTIARSAGKLVDWFSRNAVKLAHLLLHYFRVIASYIMLLLRYASRVMVNFYRQFQQDPLTSLQFVGTMMILVNGGL